MCRSEVARLLSRKNEFDAMGANLVVVVKEKPPKPEKECGQFVEVTEWPNEIYLDREMTFYKQLGEGGEFNKMGANKVTGLICGSICGSNLKSVERAKDARQFLQANSPKASTPSKLNNLKGEGLITGGLFVLSEDECYEFRERGFGQAAHLDDVLDAVEDLASRKQSA